MRFPEQGHIHTICTRVQFALVCALAAALLAAAPASADFGLSNIEVAFVEADGTAARQAGSHPFAMRTAFEVNSQIGPKGGPVVDGAIRDLDITMPAGFTGNPTAVPRCETLEFLTEEGSGHPSCSDSTAVGVLTVEVGEGGPVTGEETVAVYNLRPSPGVAAKLGFIVAEVPVTLNVGVTSTHPYNVIASLRNTSQITEVLSAVTTLWGNPADSAHDSERGRCAYSNVTGNCPAGIPTRPFLTLPRSCDGPLLTTFSALSWWSGNPESPGPPVAFSETVQSPGMTGCSKLRFSPLLEALPSSDHADSPTGLAVNLDVEDPGLQNPAGTAHSDVIETVLALPEGMTANPSLAEGLTTCTPADLGRETLASAPGEGCPQASKIGALEVETPILEGKVLHGAMFIATQDDPTTPQLGAENPFDSLLAFYIVIKDPEVGAIVKQPGLIEPDPATGQLVTYLEDLPPVPLSHVRLALREGGRSPLVTPPSCGTFTSEAELVPSGEPASALVVPFSFQITRGVGGGPCPPAGAPPFAPGFRAGAINNNAGSYSPFHMRLTRRDGDQDLTRFDATLPPGMIAKLAGVEKCADAAIATAKTKTGRVELASPSCPANSQIGNVKGGAGVGSQLTYAAGKLYLAGPVAGAPLSVVGIVPAVAGPFDVGTVVVRQALRVDPKSGEASVDGASSDPIPHILAGIPLRVRDIRVDVDRSQFTLNPTSCNRFATQAQIWGGGSALFSTADDAPVSRTAPYQAANCSRLGFKPRVSLNLKGGTKRGGHPALRSVYRPRPGDANLAGLVARLPRSAFLDQAHIRTICTRVQFAADNCPKGAIYGNATAFTPILDEPLSGPVYLRSSDNNLPDLVLDLHGLVDIEVSARIDSIKGGIRATFEKAPDAPLSKAVLNMQGGKKGLIVNSRSLCAGTNRAKIALEAQSGKVRKLRPVVRATGCAKSRRGGLRR
ncbi:MAG TPA: hypothetical protein VF729_09930 [Solirubrobacterales bacterium]